MAEKETRPLYLVDASIYVFRAYFSIPDTFVDGQGESVNAVYGYTQFLLDLLEKQPENISVAFDESLNTCYRNDIYPLYKANRELPDDNLKFQFSCCQEITNLLGFHSLCLKEYEADDIIGTLLTRFAKNRSAIIVTRDKDLGQLLRSEDKLWDFAANQFSGPAEIKEKFGVEAHQIADYLALAGDSVDNIPGVPGVGPKTASALLEYFDSIDELYANLDKVADLPVRGAGKLGARLAEHEDKVTISRQLTQIRYDAPVESHEEALARQVPDLEGLYSLYDGVGFGDGLRRQAQRIVNMF